MPKLEWSYKTEVHREKNTAQKTKKILFTKTNWLHVPAAFQIPSDSIQGCVSYLPFDKIIGFK